MPPPDPPPHRSLGLPFIVRSEKVAHPLAAYLLRLMDLKSSNLCVSADVATARGLLQLAEAVGPSIVILKTHHDIVSDWDHSPHTGTGARLARLARRHGFLIFEDRKLGDIGNTVQLQYTGGAARIIDWAHMINLNMVAGPATVAALHEAADLWRERYPYRVHTSVSADGPKAGSPSGEGHDGKLGQDGGDGNGDGEGRKGSIVSVTTVTQHYEPAGARGVGDDEAPFPGIDEAPLDRGLLILAQMSSAGNFMGPEYTRACVEEARAHRGFVMGFVSQECLNSEPDDWFIHFAPGCQLPAADEETNDGDGGGGGVRGDGKGQHYNTPQRLVEQGGVDVVIVGRGIYKAVDPQAEAERYRREAWKAYLSRIQ